MHCTIKFIDFFYKWAGSIQNSITTKKKPTITFEFGLNTENLKLTKTKNKNNLKLNSPFLAKNDKNDHYAFSNAQLSTLPKPKITAYNKYKKFIETFKSLPPWTRKIGIFTILVYYLNQNKLRSILQHKTVLLDEHFYKTSFSSGT